MEYIVHIKFRTLLEHAVLIGYLLPSSNYNAYVWCKKTCTFKTRHEELQNSNPSFPLLAHPTLQIIPLEVISMSLRKPMFFNSFVHQKASVSITLLRVSVTRISCGCGLFEGTCSCYLKDEYWRQRLLLRSVFRWPRTWNIDNLQHLLPRLSNKR